MPRKEISWKRRTPTGERVEINAQQEAERWIFYARAGRHEQWRVLDDPLLEDWMHLLDALSRRVRRGLFRREEQARLSKIIRDRFPDADLPT